MAWKKLGLLFSPQGGHPQLLSHAANPMPILLEGDIFRIFFSGRDSFNRSSVGYVDIDLIQRKVVSYLDEPVFTYGKKNSFFSDGVSIGNFYEDNGRLFILFMGWHKPQNSHWRGEIGRLIVNKDWSLTLDGTGPFIPLDQLDPISLSYPWVHKDGQSGEYQMWYGSTLSWDAGNGDMVHVIKHAKSVDGEGWDKTESVIPHTLNIAQAFSHPSVLVDEYNTHHMWFSYRGGNGMPYRIGYSYKEEGAIWSQPLDEGGIMPSIEGWDSEMVEYPYVFCHKGGRYMLYNGNGFGKTGFGLAIWE
jgi:hypothetical protein